jgi:hypothetical protein
MIKRSIMGASKSNITVCNQKRKIKQMFETDTRSFPITSQSDGIVSKCSIQFGTPIVKEDPVHSL